MARPGTRLDSCSAEGTPENHAATTRGAEVKPPKPTTMSGRLRRIRRRQNQNAWACEMMHFAIFHGCQANPVPGMRSKRKSGYFSLSRASTFFWLISSDVSCPRARKPSANEMPGERWPPVPPQEMMNRLMRKKGQETSDQVPRRVAD